VEAATIAASNDLTVTVRLTEEEQRAQKQKARLDQVPYLTYMELDTQAGHNPYVTA